MSGCCDQAGSSRVTVQVTLAEPLHARLAMALACRAMQLAGAVRLRVGDRCVDAKDALALLELALPAGAQLGVLVEGPQAEDAAQALRVLLENSQRPSVIPVAVLAPGVARAPARRGPPATVADGAAILLVHSITPAELRAWPAGTLAGVALVRGEPSSHAAVLARALGLPMVAGLPPETLERVADGQPVLIDGANALVDLSPDPTMRPPELAATLEMPERGDVAFGALEVSVQAEADTPAGVRAALAVGADGVGLVRTELLYPERKTAPDVDEQLADYEALLASAEGRGITFRLFDLAEDKRPPFAVAGLSRTDRAERGAGALLCLPAVLIAQLEAFGRLAAGAPVDVLVPGVRTPEEWSAIRQLAEPVRSAAAGHLRIGPMLETAAAALCVDACLEGADLLALGTSDLVASLFGLPRGVERVCGESVYLQPALLRLVERVARAAHGRGLRVSACGAMASHHLGALLLAALGVDALTVPTFRLAETRALLAQPGRGSLSALGPELASATDAREVRALLRRWLPTVVIESA